jgi:hypothetical protein
MKNNRLKTRRAMSSFTRLALISILALGSVPAFAESAASTASRSANGIGVDSVMVRKLYMDGDFDPAVAILESDLHSQKILSHGDSVFIFKHLGVMYAARYETRERGKMYMHQLLMAEPTAKIMDMYASDMIYMIFKNIQDEFITNRARLLETQQPPPKPESNRHLGIWIGAAVITVGVGAYFLIAALTSNSGSGGNHGF